MDSRITINLRFQVQISPCPECWVEASNVQLKTYETWFGWLG
jgi:hypothetical protein